MSKLIKLSDVAKALDVSVVTVSKALSGQKGVSESKRKQIIDLADKLGYVYTSKPKISYNIAVLVHERYMDSCGSFYHRIYQNLNHKAALKNSYTMLFTINEDMERQFVVPDVIINKKIDGVIVIGKISSGYLHFLEEEFHIPTVFIDYFDNNINLDVVLSDSYYGAYLLTKYLIDRGHRDIAYVGTLLATGSITDRYLGYKKCMLENSLTVKDEWIIDDRHKETGVIDDVKLMKLPEKLPTAFFCNCDLVASKLISKLEYMGYCIPNDVSVVGYDNYLLPKQCDVEITTYEVNLSEIAKISISNIINKIDKKRFQKGITIVEGKLIEKKSVKRI